MEEAKLKEIRSAEQEADRILEDAKSQVRKILQTAQEEGSALLDREKEKAREEAARLIDKNRAEAKQEADTVTSGTGPELEDIRKKSESRIGKAVGHVLQEIRR